MPNGISAARLLKQLGEQPSHVEIANLIKRADAQTLRQVAQEAAPEQLQKVVDALHPHDLEVLLPHLVDRAHELHLPDHIKIPDGVRATGWGFPFDHLPDDPALGVALVRASDLAVMRVSFVGMTLSDGKPPEVRPDGDGPHLIVVTLPPQHLLEQSFVLSAEGDLPSGFRLPGKFLEVAKSITRGEPLQISRLPPVEFPQATATQIGRLVVAPELIGAVKAISASEEAVADGRAPAPPPVLAQLAGTSRLVFVVPADHPPIPCTDAAILEALTQLDLKLPDAVARAKGAALDFTLLDKARLLQPAAPEPARASPLWAQAVLGARTLTAVRTGMLSRTTFVDVDPLPVAFATPPQPAEPAHDETSIELPHRLLIAPDKGAAWFHAATPRELGGRVELWTSWLAARRPDGTADLHLNSRRTFRAVWTRDRDFAPDKPLKDVPTTDPFLSSLTTADRVQIVQLTSNATIDDGEYVPRPVDASALGLSALGAWLDAEGKFPDPSPGEFSMLRWRHRAAMGRDSEVRVVLAGHLLPFGHRAALIVATDRRFHPDRPGNPAYLRTQFFVVVREPERDVAESGVLYDGSDAARKGQKLDLQTPFTRVRVTTRITPALDLPDDLSGNDKRWLFWPKVGGKPVSFAMEGLDRGGREVQFHLPLLFADDAYLKSGDAAMPAKLAEVYDGGAGSDVATGPGADPALRTIDAAGRMISYADPHAPDDTAFATQRIELGLGMPRSAEAIKDAVHDGRTPFVPVALSADIDVPALKQFVPESARMRVRYHGHFLEDGFSAAGAGAGEVFLEAVDEVPLSFDRQSGAAGGFVTPNFAVRALSRKLGPVGGNVDEYRSGTLDLHAVFDQLGAKLFGAVNLADIIDAAVPLEDAVPKIAGQVLDAAGAFVRSLTQLEAEAQAAGVALGAAEAKVQATVDTVAALVRGEERDLDPVLNDLVGALGDLPDLSNAQEAAQRRFARRVKDVRDQLADVTAFAAQLEGVAKGLQMASGAHAQMEWRPRLVAAPKDAPIFVPNDPQGLRLAVDVAPALSAGGAPESSVSCSLTSFDLDLGPIRLQFEKLAFALEPGQKPDVDVVLKGVRFEDELAFVQTLTDILPLDGFSDPPDLTVTAEGITASFSTSVPSVAVGVLSLQDLSLSAACRVPLIGSSPLSFRFDFCEAKRPAQLTVGMFGGGAYFGVEIQPIGEQKLVALRAAFEFGAGVAMDFGVASGSILVRAGIYFELRGDGSISLTGYFRARGEVDVLGLISASIELRLELTYDGQKLRGRASLEIEVEIAWFSITVTVTCERQFSGGNGDPTFAQVMAPAPEFDIDPWTEYCEAFA